MKTSQDHFVYIQERYKQLIEKEDFFTHNIKLVRIFNYLRLLHHDQRYEMVTEGIRHAAKAISEKKSFILNIVDQTNAGGSHSVKILVCPAEKKAFLEIPEEPTEMILGQRKASYGTKGGRHPTICHGIEVIVASFKKAKELFPELEFGFSKNDFLYSLQKLYHQAKEIKFLIPLTIDPPNTNLLIFHTQVPHVNPEILARGWYEIIKLDTTLDSDPIRHTIFVMPISPTPEYPNTHFGTDQPKSKTQIYTEVLPKRLVEDRSRFRPMHLNRISRWEKLPELNKEEMPKIEHSDTRKIIHLK